MIAAHYVQSIRRPRENRFFAFFKKSVFYCYFELMFDTLVYFKVTNNFGAAKLCKQEPFAEKVHGWTQGSCAAAGYSYLWSENQSSGLEEFRNFKKY